MALDLKWTGFGLDWGTVGFDCNWIRLVCIRIVLSWIGIGLNQVKFVLELD